MGLESPSFVNDLVVTNPEGTDARSQGDDHIRNLKSALKSTLPNAERAFYFPTTTVKSAAFTVSSTDQNKLFYVDASGQTTSLQVALPQTLTASNAGWQCSFAKADVSSIPLIITASSGTLNSGTVLALSSLRRGIVGTPFSAIWTGVNWVVTRCVQLPLGAVLDVPTTSLPAGYEWANGQSLSSSALYPEFFSHMGSLTVQDRRGRAAFGRDDMGGSAAGRITASSGITGTSLGATGGFQTGALTTNELPVHSHVININDPQHTHGVTGGTVAGTAVGTGGAVGTVPLNAATIAISSATTGITATSNPTGSGAAFSIMPPTIITNHIVVVE